MILFCIMFVWKWYHVLWNNCRLGTASCTCVSSGKQDLSQETNPANRNPRKKSLHAFEMSRFSLSPSITDQIGRRRGFSIMPDHGGTCPVAHPTPWPHLLPLATFVQLFSTVPPFGFTSWCSSWAVPGRQLLS